MCGMCASGFWAALNLVCNLVYYLRAVHIASQPFVPTPEKNGHFSQHVERKTSREGAAPGALAPHTPHARGAHPHERHRTGAYPPRAPGVAARRVVPRP